MPQSIFIQVGQCGNQIGFSFWKYVMQEYVMQEHELHDCVSDDEINYFFEPACDWACDKKFQDCYKARGVLVDMEENVISQGVRGPLGNLFSQDQILTDVSGSGNNWAVGNNYGTKHKDSIENLLRRQTERCDYLETFLLTFSLGGGTGSGLGSYILNHLQDEYPGFPRIVFAAFPSLIDDVVTSPYNAILANNELMDKANLVIPFENQILNSVCQRHFKKRSIAAIPEVGICRNTLSQEKPFDDMNRIIAYTMLDLTSSCRFSGNLNLDMADVFTNLVPSPHLIYAIPSITPLSPEDDSSSKQLIKDILSGSNQLTSCAIMKGTVLSSILQARGKITLLDIESKLEEKIGTDFRFFQPFNRMLKIGICNTPRLNFSRSLLQLSNCTSISHTFRAMKSNFSRMFEKKAHLHHFLDIDSDICSKLESAVQQMDDIISSYIEYENYLPNAGDSRPSVL